MTGEHDSDFEELLATRLRTHLDQAVVAFDAPAIVDRLAVQPMAQRRVPRTGWLTVATVTLAGVLTIAALGILVPAFSSTPGASLPGSASRSPSPSLPPSSSGVDDAGAVASGGFWARRGSDFYISTDAGETWSHGSMDSHAYSVRVLDADRAFSVTVGPGSTPVTGSPTDVLHFVVNRTEDGGQTWRSVPIDGNYAAMEPVVSFVDDQHGFLLFSPGRFAQQHSVIWRTVDGGATWDKVGSAPSLGQLFVAVDRLRMFAGAPPSAAPITMWPTLAQSADGGVTWREVELPNSPLYLLTSPVFFGETGIAIVANANGVTGLIHSGDGGLAWESIGHIPLDGQLGTGSFLNKSQWYLTGSQGPKIAVSSDAGASWRDVGSQGLPEAAVSWLGFVDPLHGMAVVPLGDTSAPSGLFLTSDGGQTWETAPLPTPGATS